MNRQQPRPRNRQSTQAEIGGFTLVELVLAVVIVAIFAAIALPIFQDYVRRARRADAQQVLAQISQFYERSLTLNSIFTGPFPPALATIPATATGTSVRYNITATPVATANSYLITATPVNDQVADRCGLMTIADTGVRTATLNDCWPQ